MIWFWFWFCESTCWCSLLNQFNNYYGIDGFGEHKMKDNIVVLDINNDQTEKPAQSPQPSSHFVPIVAFNWSSVVESSKFQNIEYKFAFMFSSYWSTITQINWLNRKNAKKWTIQYPLHYNIRLLTWFNCHWMCEEKRVKHIACVCFYLLMSAYLCGEVSSIQNFLVVLRITQFFDFLQMLKQEPSNKNVPSFVWRRHKLLLFAFILNELIWINRLALHWASFVVNEYQFFKISLTKF